MPESESSRMNIMIAMEPIPEVQLNMMENLYLLYTGNTRDENWERHPYQCLASDGQMENMKNGSSQSLEMFQKDILTIFAIRKFGKKGNTFMQ